MTLPTRGHTEMDATILITTAIRPPSGVPYLKMTDSSSRTVATRCGIFFWASQKVKNIVIADATGCKVLCAEEEDLLAKMGVNVEQISYNQDNDSIKERGKGYAEGLLID